MTIKFQNIILIFGAVFFSGLAIHAQEKHQSSASVPVDVEIPFAPIPVKAMDKMNLAYEIHITNFSRTPLALAGVEVLADNAASTQLANYRDAELVKRMAVMNFVSETQEKNVIGAGQRAIVFLLVSADAGSVPAALKHRLAFKSTEAAALGANEEVKEQIIEGVRVAVQNEKPLVVGAPLSGRWLAGNGLSNDTGHRRSEIAVGGRARIAQRFATDWIKLGDDGLVARGGDMSQNANYYGYGAQAVAVADGVVVETKDGIPENTPQIKKRAVPMTLETIAGNYVLLDIGGGRFALYAHFQPGSLKVKTGDRVKVGQVLGSVGNSGNSDLPHLHFQIADAASPLGAEGVPYVLKSFKMQGVVKVDADFIKNGFKPDPTAATKREMELPIQNAVVLLQ